MPLEEYVRGTILSEFAPPSGDPADIERMLEVQAVIARTYAVAHIGRHQRDGFDLCSTTHCQLYQPGRLKTSSWARLAVDAARHTASQVLWFNSAPASALFHADCGGHTSAATDIWGGTAHPYLAGLADDGAAGGAHVTWRYEVGRGELLAALNADPRTRVGTSLRDISVTERDGAGRAMLVVLNGSRAPVVRGEELRTVLTPHVRRENHPQHALSGHAVGAAFRLHRPGLRPRRRALSGRRLCPPQGRRATRAGPGALLPGDAADRYAVGLLGRGLAVRGS